jgi:hypothetical protein
VADRQRVRQPNLRGRQPRAPRGCLYVDESASPGWFYVGILAVAADDASELLDCLEADRADVGYDRELHFQEITTSQKASLGSRWLRRARQPDSPRICFHVLGIDLTKINRQAFGHRGREQRENLYRRILRMALKYAMLAFFPDDACVRGIFHDARNLGATEYFDWHTPQRLRGEGLPVAVDRIVLVDSDHAASDSRTTSTLIQLIDVILGATRVCLDATTTEQHKLRLASEWLPLVEGLTASGRRRWRSNDHFGHVGRCNLSFFPMRSLTLAQLNDPEVRLSSDFYSERTPALSAQAELPLL